MSGIRAYADLVIIRRAFYYWQFIAAIALPVWLLVGWGFFGGDGWQFLALVFVCPLLAVVMLAIAGITVARKSVRERHALSWPDVGLLALWHLVIIGAGTFGVATNALAVFTVLIALGMFWLTLWELFTETRRRLTGVLDALEGQASGATRANRPSPFEPSPFGPSPAEQTRPKPAFDPNRPQDGQTIRLD